MSTQFALPVMIMGFLIPSIAAAHPGHSQGTGEYNILHYLNDPLHIVLWLSLAVVILTAVAWARRTP